MYAYNPELQNYLKQHIPSPDVAIQNLDMTVNSVISELTGLNISSNGTNIKDGKVQLNKADVEAIISGKDVIKSVKTIKIDGKPYSVSGIQVSADDEYYIVSIQES